MKGIILINTGSPDSYSQADVGKYLRQFLMDGRVIDVPLLFRFLLVHGIIAPFRKYKSAKAYASVWTKEGAPLIVSTAKLAKKLQHKLNIPCEIAMRYGSMTVEAAYRRLMAKSMDIDEIIVVPLFPHYAMSSYESAVAHSTGELARLAPGVTVSVIAPFYKNPDYISSLVSLFKGIDVESYDHIQFTYHSIPLRQLDKSTRGCTGAEQKERDYHYQVNVTSELVAKSIGMEGKYGVSFQSAMGKSWLQPSSADVLREMPAKGIKRLLVVSPSFVADNLETLKDIDMELRQAFLEVGGEEIKYIPCLNDADIWVDALAKICLSE